MTLKDLNANNNANALTENVLVPPFFASISDRPLGEGQLTGEQVVIWNPEIGSKIFKLGYFGKPVGIRKPKSPRFNRPLELSPFDALYLMEHGIIIVRDENEVKICSDEYFELCKTRFNLFEDLYAVYKDLRNKKYVVRPGLKFGTDFSVYKRGPGIEHSVFVVSVFPREKKLAAIDLVRAGRVATTVRKKYVIATVLEDKSIRYYIFKWKKL